MTNTDPANIDREVDEALLSNPDNEILYPFDYIYWATTYLHQKFLADRKLRGSPLSTQIASLLEYWDTDPAIRSVEVANEKTMDLHLLGAVGKALWFLKEKSDHQLNKELYRLAHNPESVVGTHYLFYIVGILASKGVNVSFVSEQGKNGGKTPDIVADKGGYKTWIEANAKQPNIPVDTPERIQFMIRDIIAEKSQKFSDAQYWPGMIVADISPADLSKNETGTLPFLRLREDLIRLSGTDINDGFIYPLYEDKDWKNSPENQGNVFAYLIDEFSKIDRSTRQVNQCLVTLTRRVQEAPSKISFPKYHVLVVDRSVEDHALTELCKFVYVVDSKG